MKILNLRFQNLNSIKGESPLIDFEAEPFRSSGLFAITGTTGAGKTTLLDAITLALYARAPRYGSDASPEAVMTRHTGECGATVEFECNSGRYRAIWQLRRARLRPDGKVQQAIRRVEEVATGKIVAQSIRECDQIITQLTGLDYARFLRSIMLAQGDFAAFLKADAKDRTELLQKVTGTEIYEQISVFAHKTYSEANKAFETLATRQKEVQLLTPEALSEMKTSRQVLTAQIEAETAEHLDLQNTERLVRRVIELREQLQLCESQIQDLKGDETAFEFKALALEKHRKIEPIRAELKQLEDWAHLQAVLEKRLEDERSKLPEKEAKEQELREQWSNLQSTREGILKDEPAKRELFNKVRLLDEQIRQCLTQRKEKTLALQSDELLKPQITAKMEAATQALIALESEKLALETWKTEHAKDAELQALLSVWDNELARWEERVSAQTKSQKLLSNQSEKLKGLELQFESKVQEQTALKSKLETALRVHQKYVETLASVTGTKNREVLQHEFHEQQLRRDKLQRLEASLQEHARSLVAYQEKTKASQELQARREALLEKQAPLEDEFIQEEKLRLQLAADIEWMTKVQSLEQHRANLVEGEPCPLCGALEHPMADSAKETDHRLKEAKAKLFACDKSLKALQERKSALATELAALNAQSEALAKRIAELSAQSQEQSQRLQDEAHSLGLVGELSSASMGQALTDVEAQLSELQRQMAEVQRCHEAVESSKQAVQELTQTSHALDLNLQKLKGEWDVAKAESQQLQERVNQMDSEVQQVELDLKAQLQTWVGFGDGEAWNSAVAANQLSVLKARHQTWLQKMNQLEQGLQRLPLLQKAQLDAQHAWNEVQSRVERVNTELEDIHQRLSQLQPQRAECFGEKSVDEAERALRLTLDSAQKACDEAQASLQKIVSDIAGSKQRLLEIEESLDDHAQRKLTLEQVVHSHVATLGYADVAAMKADVLAEDLYREWSAIEKQLRERNIQLKTQHETHTKELEKLGEVSDQALEGLPALQAQLQKLGSALNEKRESLGGLNRELQLDEVNRQKHAAFASEIDLAAAERKRWSDLNDLIGSSDGSKFARFAQSLTLDQLVLLANRHLQCLNPRYSMLSNPEKLENLELLIIDHYQADVIRPMASLSGGETFLVSLALALGLSELVGGKHRVESLFIDEGFGTLDAETLDIAMDALENLRRSDKTIGIISHVEALKERITTQIQIQKMDGGVSQLKIVA